MTQPKMFEEGTKEELIAHFKAASKAWDYIIQGKDAEIDKLHKTVRDYQIKLAEALKANHSDKVHKLEYEISSLKDRIQHIKVAIRDLSESII